MAPGTARRAGDGSGPELLLTDGASAPEGSVNACAGDGHARSPDAGADVCSALWFAGQGTGAIRRKQVMNAIGTVTARIAGSAFASGFAALERNS